MNILSWLSAMLALRVVDESNAEDPPTQEAQDEGETQPEAITVDENTIDSLLGSVEDRTTDEDVRAENARLKAELEQSRRAAPAPVEAPLARPSRDPQYDAEEEQLRQARTQNDPNLPFIEWKIQSNRSLRESREDARNARLLAADTVDQQAFFRLRDKNPKTFDKFAPEVEKHAQQMRQNGNPVNRGLIYSLLVGQAVLEGKVKPKAQAQPAKKPEAKAAPAQQTVNRGRPLGMRSDVGARQKDDEREARRERLRTFKL